MGMAVMVMTPVVVAVVLMPAPMAADTKHLRIRGDTEDQRQNQEGKCFHGKEVEFVRHGGLGKVSATYSDLSGTLAEGCVLGEIIRLSGSPPA
jgi:hypothetical protein